MRRFGCVGRARPAGATLRSHRGPICTPTSAGKRTVYAAHLDYHNRPLLTVFSLADRGRPYTWRHACFVPAERSSTHVRSERRATVLYEERSRFLKVAGGANSEHATQQSGLTRNVRTNLLPSPESIHNFTSIELVVHALEEDDRKRSWRRRRRRRRVASYMSRSARDYSGICFCVRCGARTKNISNSSQVVSPCVGLGPTCVSPCKGSGRYVIKVSLLYLTTYT